mgnify:CR=1 FL=1
MKLNPRLPHLLLFALMAVYAAYFSWYTINRHNTLNSYAADLSLIDQPMWNTAIGPGGFMELTWGDHQQPRLAEHFEPILAPLSFLFYLWDDVRLLLVVQSLALALGALPVFWLARDRLAVGPISLPAAEWAGLIFAAAFLLTPHLQAANIADFHADPFIVAPLLFALWYGLRRRWRWFWLWALIAMLTKETLPTLTAMLGLWLLLHAWQTRREQPPRPAILHGLGLIAVSTAWFLAATFLIVAPLARQYFGTNGPIYLANRYPGNAAPLALLTDPARWRYLLGLLAAAGFLPLLAPELLLLGLPVLAANMLSGFAGQYSGEQHYSAPLVAAFIAAAIFGLRRLLVHLPPRRITGQMLSHTALFAASLWLLGWSLGYHTLHGWTPLSIRTESYTTTPAAAALPGLLARIPADAVVSASAGLHPHIAHRRVAYIFPTLANADFALVDVTDVPGSHPNDVRAKLLAMLADGWQLVATGPGLLLAQHTGAPTAGPLPDSFFDFARAAGPPAITADVSFNSGQLTLLGYDVLDDPDDGVIFRFYWQAAGPLPDDLRLWPLVFDDTGQLLANPAQVPMIAAVWYPPARWQPTEIIVTKTLPQMLPATFHLGLAVGPGEASLSDPAARWSIAGHAGGWAQLASFRRQGPFLTRLAPTPTFLPLRPAQAQFGPAIRLTGFYFQPDAVSPGGELPLLLRWQASAPPAADYTVFIHLLNAAGERVAQTDAFPAWLGLQPTSRWPVNQPLLDRHTLSLPANLPPGIYTLQLGLYQAQSLERLPLTTGGNTLELGRITVK